MLHYSGKVWLGERQWLTVALLSRNKSAVFRTSSSVPPPWSRSAPRVPDRSVPPPRPGSVAPPPGSSVAPPWSRRVVPRPGSSVPPPWRGSVVPPRDRNVPPAWRGSVAQLPDKSVPPLWSRSVAIPRDRSVAPAWSRSAGPPPGRSVPPAWSRSAPASPGGAAGKFPVSPAGQSTKPCVGDLLGAGALGTGRREPLAISRTSLLVFLVRRATEEVMEDTVEDGEVEVEVTVDQFLNNNAPPPMKISVPLGTSKAADQGGIQSIKKIIKHLTINFDKKQILI